MESKTLENLCHEMRNQERNDVQMHPRTAKISSFLQRFYMEHKTRFSRNSFAIEAKSVMTTNEANDLFEYYSDIEGVFVLLEGASRIFKFNVRQDHFNSIAVNEAIKYCGFKEEIQQKRQRVIVRTKSIEMKDLSQYSDSDLEQELKRRKEERKKQEEILAKKTLLETAAKSVKLSMTDLCKLVAEINNLIGC